MEKQDKFDAIDELERICGVMRQYAQNKESEQELYDTITELQTRAYQLRALIWTKWVEGGILEEMRPRISK